MLDDLRVYLQMASGVTEATTTKAKEVVAGLLATGFSLTSRAMPGPEVVGQVQELADDLVATSRTNRELLVGLIRSEVDRAVGRMGFVREDELAALRRHVQRLEKELGELQDKADTCCVAVVEEVDVLPIAEPAAVVVEVVEEVEPTVPDVAEDDASGAASCEPKKKKKKILLEGASDE